MAEAHASEGAEVGDQGDGAASSPPSGARIASRAPENAPRVGVTDTHATSAASAPTEADAEIVALLSRGEARRAIALSARLLGPSIGRLCFAMLGDQAEADEALQETLLGAYDGASSFRGEGSVRAWLYGIARRTCAKRIEIRTRQARRRTLLQGDDEPAKPADQELDELRRGEAVRRALEGLRPTEREAVLLRYEADLSFRDVASACGIAEEAARQRVSRALSKLRDKLSD
jgi:RNA polymerase sigma-70 factor (ECF subfamily)